MGIVGDFEKELRRKSKARFATWHAIDLHNHSPTSMDYKGETEGAAKRTAERINQTDISVVMFTDHGQLPDKQFTSEVADKSGRLVLRGVELNVFVDAWGKPENKVSKDVFFHLLIGFDPEADQPPEYWLSHIYRECKESERLSGERSVRGIAAPLDKLVEVIRDSNAILIPAHLHSTADAFKSRSIDDIYSDSEFLRYAKHYFTALEVTSEKTAAFFDGQHDETGRLLKTCIRSSDAHEPGLIGSRLSYAEMERPSYSELKAALELPSRTSLLEPSKPNSYIVGLHVQGAFFPDLWLECSSYCNVLIGVKGSGKTSVLECLRYVLGAEIPDSKKDGVGEHLDTILGSSGKVRVLLRRGD